MRKDLSGEAVDAAVHAQREAVARIANRAQHVGQFGHSIADDMQNGAKHLVPQLVQALYFVHSRGDEVAAGTGVAGRRTGAARIGPCGQQPALFIHALRVALEHQPRVAIDHRPDIRRPLQGIAHGQFAQGPAQHVNYRIGDVLL